MKRINSLDRLNTTPRPMDNREVNWQFLWAYLDSVDADNETINFALGFQLEEIPIIVDECRKYGFDHITLSFYAYDMMAILWRFEELGCSIGGMQLTNTRTKPATPALVIRL